MANISPICARERKNNENSYLEIKNDRKSVELGEFWRWAGMEFILFFKKTINKTTNFTNWFWKEVSLT